MSNKTIPPAFPLLPPVDDTGRSAVGYPFPDPGMTLRDYFAAKSLGHLITHYSTMNCIVSKCHLEIAQEAYSLADAMLKAREQ